MYKRNKGDCQRVWKHRGSYSAHRRIYVVYIVNMLVRMDTHRLLGLLWLYGDGDADFYRFVATCRCIQMENFVKQFHIYCAICIHIP